MPNSRHSEAIVSPSLSRITNRIRSSITERSFHSIHKWDIIVALGFCVSALGSAGRLAEGYLGQRWLGHLKNAADSAVVLFSFGTLGLWLWWQAQSTELKPASE